MKNPTTISSGESDERIERAAAAARHAYFGASRHPIKFANIQPEAQEVWRKVARAALATQPAAPAEVVGWVSPEQLAAHPDGGEDASGRYLPVRKTPAGKFTMPIYGDALASPAQAPTDPIRVACVTLDGSTLTVPLDQIGDVLHGEDDQHTYTLTLKTMTRAEFDALGDFNGF